MKLAILIASRNRPELVDALVAQLEHTSIEHDVFVVECGSDAGHLSRHATLWYPDGPEGFQGKCFGHYLVQQQARASGPYDYYLVLMNDVVFEPGVDVAKALIDTLEREERMAILSPTCADGLYPGSGRRPGGGWRAAATVDYLGFMIRGAAVEEVGFLNPEFRYCWGAIHELAFKLHRAGWFVAYSDDVTYEHLGGSTYGARGTNTVSREEYQQRARRFAYDYFLERYGPDWERLFFAAAEHAIEIDTFAEHKRLWSEGFSPAELDARRARATRRAERFCPRSGPGLVRLHLGSGSEYRDGWINFDTNPAVRADVHGSVTELKGVADASVDVIEALHLFEHLTAADAQRALREWARVLKPGGELFLELPDLEACLRLVGRHVHEGVDLAVAGIFGWPPEIERQGEPMMHKWGWTRATIAHALVGAGFEAIDFGPITQTWRPAARIGRDVRVRANKPVPVTRAPVSTATAPVAQATAPARAVQATRPASPARAAARDRFPLATDADVRILAWPNYADPGELELLFERFGRVLSEHPSACLCLRHDPASDGPDDEVAAALQQAYEATLGGDVELAVLLINDALEGDDWRRLGAAVDGLVLLPSSSASPRAEALARTRAKTVASPDRLRALLGFGAPTSGAPTDLSPAPRDADGNYAEGILNAIDWRLVEQIGELNPWTYPAVLGNLRVHPGKGTDHTPEVLEERTRRLARLVLNTAEVDFEGRSLLELGCDCAYWSARSVELGATSVVGVDKNERKLRQAELYFSRNEYLPAERRTFLHGDLADASTWERIERLGPFDVTLAVGLIERADDPSELLRRAAAATSETLVVVTRLAQADRLVETLVPLGFEATVEDDLEAGLTAWVARRTRVAAPRLTKTSSSSAA